MDKCVLSYPKIDEPIQSVCVDKTKSMSSRTIHTVVQSQVLNDWMRHYNLLVKNRAHLKLRSELATCT